MGVLDRARWVRGRDGRFACYGWSLCTKTGTRGTNRTEWHFVWTPSASPWSRGGPSVNGQLKVPIGGHEFCP